MKFLFLLFPVLSFCINQYYVTSFDSKFFKNGCALIDSINNTNKDSFKEIAVFNLGLTNLEKKILSQKQNVKIYEVEKRHPDILKKFITSPQKRSVPGWFVWKPIVIKQALDIFPYILYLDSGTKVLKSLDNLFKHIASVGYFFVDAGPHGIIRSRITKYVINNFLNNFPIQFRSKVLNTDLRMLSAGIQGLSRKYYKDYVLPVYNCTNNLNYFKDDGSSPLGFGSGRHDQTLFSIYAHFLGLQINNEGWMSLFIDGKEEKFHAHWSQKEINKFSSFKW